MGNDVTLYFVCTFSLHGRPRPSWRIVKRTRDEASARAFFSTVAINDRTLQKVLFRMNPSTHEHALLDATGNYHDGSTEVARVGTLRVLHQRRGA